MSFEPLFERAVHAYRDNLKLISFFSIPLIIAFPLLLLLPNYAALGGIFLRPGSLGLDVSALGTVYMLIVLIIALLLFSFAIVAVNSVIKSQRSLTTLKHADLERMESSTFRLFGLLFVVFLAIFGFNLLLFELALSEKLRLVLNSLFSLAASLLILFAPQAIVIDGAKLEHAFALSASVLSKKPAYVIALLTFGALVLLANAAIFDALTGVFPPAPLAAIVLSSLVIVPFLEVLKVQIYLTKYSLL